MYGVGTFEKDREEILQRYDASGYRIRVARGNHSKLEAVIGLMKPEIATCFHSVLRAVGENVYAFVVFFRGKACGLVFAFSQTESTGYDSSLGGEQIMVSTFDFIPPHKILHNALICTHEATLHVMDQVERPVTKLVIPKLVLDPHPQSREPVPAFIPTPIGIPDVMAELRVRSELVSVMEAATKALSVPAETS